MKILFSNPPWWKYVSGRQLKLGIRAGSRWPFMQDTNSIPDEKLEREYIPYPFFMAFATTYLAEKTNHQVVFRDSIAYRESYARYYQHIQDEQYDFVFIESATSSWEHDTHVITKIKELSPCTKIVITGPITTTSSEIILAENKVWACIKGEYEKGSVRVINGQSGIIDFDLLSEGEMNASPFPYMDESYVGKYWDSNPEGQIFPHLQIWTSRGCPYKCIFCVWPATMTGNDPDGTKTRTVRHYSKEYLERYVSDYVQIFGFKSVLVDDDTFNLGNAHVNSFCEVMKKVNLPWSAMCRADTISLEVWLTMKLSGCFGVKIGIESGSQRVIDHIVKKRLDLKNASRVIHYLDRIGLKVHGTFTYGLPGETLEEMRMTKDFIASNPFTTVQESGTAEVEGTPLHTLRTKGSLPKYPDARIDENYLLNSDGQEKIEQLNSKK